MERGLSQESYDLKGNPRFFFLRLPENCAYISGKSTGRLGSIVLLDAPSSTIRFSLIVLLDSASSYYSILRILLLDIAVLCIRCDAAYLLSGKEETFMGKKENGELP